MFAVTNTLVNFKRMTLSTYCFLFAKKSKNAKVSVPVSLVLAFIGCFLILCPALSYLVTSGFLAIFEMKLDISTVIILLRNMWLLDLVPKFAGAVLLVYVLYRNHFSLGRPKLSRQLTPIFAMGAIILLLISAVFLDIPVAHAEAIATTNFFLDTPLPISDWYIGRYSSNSYFAINGSNWDNLMGGVGSSNWASFASNFTKIEEMVLTSITFGTVYLKEVPFNYNLTIPVNVSVIENVNGLTRTFCNANIQGDVYTISVDSINFGYYLAQDSTNRFINNLTSKDASLIITNCWALGDTFISEGNYILNEPINKTNSGFMISGSSSTVLIAKDQLNNNLIQINNVSNVTISNIHINGNQYNQIEQPGLDFANSGICIQNCTAITLNDLTITNTYAHGIVTKNVSASTFRGNTIINCGNNGGVYASEACIVIFWHSSNNIVTGNLLSTATRGIYLSEYATGNVIDNNIIINCGEGVHFSSNGCANDTVIGNIMSGNNTGINIEQPTGQSPSSQIMITNNQMNKFAYGILIHNCSNAQVIGNTIIVSQPLVIYEGSDNIQVANNKLVSSGTFHFDAISTSAKNGTFVGNAVSTNILHFCFRENPGASSNFITANTFSSGNGQIGNISLLQDGSSKITNNMGFTTENSGIFTITNSTNLAVDHGLSITPNGAPQITMQTAGFGSVWVTNITSTQFTINVENNGTYIGTWNYP